MLRSERVFVVKMVKVANVYFILGRSSSGYGFNSGILAIIWQM
jgi:hypothetical protein